MTGKQARELLEKPKFGDPEHIAAVKLLLEIEKQYTGNGPNVICMSCEDPEKSIKLHRIGAYICDECGIRFDALLDKAETPVKAVAK